jgi:uncharacterized protein (DUF3084 family)
MEDVPSDGTCEDADRWCDRPTANEEAAARVREADVNYPADRSDGRVPPGA